MKKSLITLAVMASLTILSGCGSSSSNDASGEGSVSNTLSGTAAKGIIQQGIVTATELDSLGLDLRELGTTVTDSAGHYELALDDSIYQGGVVKLTVTVDENTSMKCDATEGCGEGISFGDDITFEAGDDFSLDAIIQPDPEQEAVSVQITPLTHMAAYRALEANVLDSDSISAAISEVNQIAGVNIMTTEVVDITDTEALVAASDEAKELAIFNVGLADLLVSGEGSVQDNIATNLGKLADAFEDGEFSDDDEISIADITEAITAAVTFIGDNDAIADQLESALDNVETAVIVIEDQTDGDGNYNPEPTETAAEDEIMQAKALITDARTFIEKIGTDFKDPLDALSIDAEVVGDVLSDDTAVLSSLLAEMMDQALSDVSDAFDTQDNLTDFLGSVFVTVITDTNDVEVGEITTTLSSTASGLSITFNGELTGNGEEDDSVANQTIGVTNLVLATNLTVADNLTIEDNLLTKITAEDAELTLTGKIGNLNDEEISLTFNDVLLTMLASESIELDVTEDADNEGIENSITELSFNGNVVIVANSSSFEGDVEMDLVALTDTLDVPLTLEKISVNGEFINADDESFSAGALLEITDAASFDVLVI